MQMKGEITGGLQEKKSVINSSIFHLIREGERVVRLIELYRTDHYIVFVEKVRRASLHLLQ